MMLQKTARLPWLLLRPGSVERVSDAQLDQQAEGFAARNPLGGGSQGVDRVAPSQAGAKSQVHPFAQRMGEHATQLYPQAAVVRAHVLAESVPLLPGEAYPNVLGGGNYRKA